MPELFSKKASVTENSKVLFGQLLQLPDNLIVLYLAVVPIRRGDKSGVQQAEYLYLGIPEWVCRYPEILGQKRAENVFGFVWRGHTDSGRVRAHLMFTIPEKLF